MQGRRQGATIGGDEDHLKSILSVQRLLGIMLYIENIAGDRSPVPAVPPPMHGGVLPLMGQKINYKIDFVHNAGM